MTILKYRLVVESKTIEMRRIGIKVRTYANAKVFMEGVAGRGASHWAARDFQKCVETDKPMMYFSGNGTRPGIVLHGDHVHILLRNRSGSLIDLDQHRAETEVLEFVKMLREKGIMTRLL